MDPDRELRGCGLGCLLAPCIGILTIAAMEAGHSLATGTHFLPREEWGILLINLLMVAAPFGVVAVLFGLRPTPWLAGLGLTAFFWGLLFITAMESWSNGSGANIGMGLFMLFTPFIVTAGALLAAKWSDRPHGHGEHDPGLSDEEEAGSPPTRG